MYNILVEGEDIPPPLFRFEVRLSQLNPLSSSFSFLGHEILRRYSERPEGEEDHAADAHSNARHSIRVRRTMLVVFASLTDSLLLSDSAAEI